MIKMMAVVEVILFILFKFKNLVWTFTWRWGGLSRVTVALVEHIDKRLIFGFETTTNR